MQNEAAVAFLETYILSSPNFFKSRLVFYL